MWEVLYLSLEFGRYVYGLKVLGGFLEKVGLFVIFSRSFLSRSTVGFWRCVELFSRFGGGDL